MTIRILRDSKALTYEKLQYLNEVCFPKNPFNEGIYRKVLKEPYWLVCDDDEVVGYGLVKMKERRIHLWKLAIIEGYRGQGLGHRLLNEIEKFALNNKVEALTLSVRVDNEKAIRLYRKHQYEVTGEKYQMIVSLDCIETGANLDTNLIIDEDNIHHFTFKDTEGNHVGKAVLDPMFPGCSYYDVEVPKQNLGPSLGAMKPYVNEEQAVLYMMIRQKGLADVFIEQGHVLNSALMIMEKKCFE